MAERSHWDRVYAARADEALSWFQRHPARSLALIEASGVARDAPIIDVGGGTSRLAAELLRRGYSGLWVLDISASALAAARGHLGKDARRVRWVESDVTRVALPEAHFHLWHDRAVFHFLTAPEDRAAYVDAACRAVKPGGHLVIATFAEDGPAQCSGLPVARYDAPSLYAQFAGCCELLRTEREEHRTPAGKRQAFRYCVLRRKLS